MAVYFARAEGTAYVKIGFAVNVPRRMRHLQAGCPYKLTVVRVVGGDRRAEAAYHALFSEHHVDRDWFKWSARMEYAVEPTPASVSETAGGFATLIDDLGGCFRAAARTGINKYAIHKMRKRNRIAAKHWPAFIGAGVPMERLVACEQDRTLKAAQQQSAA